MELYQDSSASPQRRSEDLLRRMSIEEKVGQLCKGRGFNAYDRHGDAITLKEDFTAFMRQRLFGCIYGVIRADWWTGRGFDNGNPATLAAKARNLFQQLALDVSRWRIPFLFVEEAPHGLMALDATVFPTGLGMGSTFDADLLSQIGLVMGRESAAAGISSIYAPILDLAIEPRWSRTEECFSENPLLVTECAAAMTRSLLDCGIAPTLKHFIGGGRCEGGHNAFTAHVGMRELHNQDLRPFRTCIALGSPFLMPTYHDIDGEPCCSSPFILTELLRNQLGFKGFTLADAGAIEMGKDAYRLARTLPQAAAIALKAGCDGDSGHERLEQCGQLLLDAWNQGLYQETDLDLAVGRLLEIKFALGLYDHPFTDGKPETVFAAAPHRDVALRAARESLVLLKNDAHTLPIAPSCRTIAVIGPNADHAMNMLGDYTAPQRPESVRTILQGIRDLAEPRHITVLHAHGCGIRSRDRSGFDEALRVAAQADLIVWVPGGCSTRFGNVQTDPVTGAAITPVINDSESSEKESGEGTDRCTLTFSGVQLELLRLLAATGKPLVSVPVMGRPLLLDETLDASAALLVAWYPGMAGGQAVAEALFGEFSPAGRLPISLPRNIGQLPVHGAAVRMRPAYVDGSGEALFPFGFGLSYTTFEYRDLTVDGRTVSVTCRNAGDVPSDEVVQFYLSSLEGPFARPRRELFAFRRIHLQPGEEQRVSVTLADEALGAYDRDGSFVTFHGAYDILAGGTPDALLQTSFTLP
ncbi:MAG: glycoside hydrolase family 3 N-terminal domain-containing protein [Oligosphaeraceae bacterium]